MSTGDDGNAVSEETRRPLARARRVVEEPIRAARAEPDSAPPPEETLPTPGVVICFRIFCAIVAFGSVVGAGFSFLPLTNNFYYDNSSGGWEFIGLLTLALAVFTLFTIPLLLPRSKPWMWWYGLALILLATFTAYLTIFGLLLLIFWVQPRVQRFFGRMVEVRSSEPRRRYRYDDDDDFDDEEESAPRRPSHRGRPSVPLD